jgi:hypothetical protein
MKVHHTEDEEERWDERYVRNMSRYKDLLKKEVLSKTPIMPQKIQWGP